MVLDLQCDSQNAFFRCVEDCNESIMISDEKGILVYVNPAWERTYGYSRAEAIGQTARLLHSGHQADEFYSEMWRQIMNPEIGTWKGEIINRAKDGTLVPVYLTITSFKSPSKVILGYMAFALDITQKKELEAKVLHQDRLASVGMLASGLAHEIGTPLGVVRGRAEFLAMQSRDPELTKGLGVITAEIDRISKLIRSLLSVSRSFSDVQVQNISIEDVVSEVMALVGRNLSDDNVDIQIRIPADLKVCADFNRMKQILLNMIMNSIHAIRKSIATVHREGHFLTIEASQRGKKVAIEVTDSGCGISPRDMKKLFQPFFTTKDIGEGTGLGLAIVAQLLREMDGEISVKSIEGKGTVFVVLLNAASP